MLPVPRHSFWMQPIAPVPVLPPVHLPYYWMPPTARAIVRQALAVLLAVFLEEVIRITFTFFHVNTLF